MNRRDLAISISVAATAAHAVAMRHETLAAAAREHERTARAAALEHAAAAREHERTARAAALEHAALGRELGALVPRPGAISQGLPPNVARTVR